MGTIALRGGDNDAPSDRVKDVARDIARTDESGKVLTSDYIAMLTGDADSVRCWRWLPTTAKRLVCNELTWMTPDRGVPG